MRKKIRRLAAACLALLLLSGCHSIAPQEKTIILSEPTATPAASNEPQSSLRFEVRRITNIPLDRLDPTGDHPNPAEAVIGWIDANNLVAMTVQSAQTGTEAEETAQASPQPTAEDDEGVRMTQFVRINYQYGFLDPILTLGNLEAECFDVSADGALVAYVAGNILDIYSLHNGGRMQTLTRDVLASRVVFAQDGHELYFTAAGEDRKMESIQAETGEVALVLPGMAYRPLAVSEKGMLFYLLSQGTQTVGYASQAGTEEELLTGGTAGSAYILSSGDGLLVYDGDLYLVGAGGATLVQSNITAFDIGSDGMHIAYAVQNEDGSVDIRIGYWGGSRIINDRLTYKDIGINVDTMYFSPDLEKLYLQGQDGNGALRAYTFEFQ